MFWSQKRFKLGGVSQSLISQTVIKILATTLGLYTTRWLIATTSATEYNDYLLIIDFVQIFLVFTDFGVSKIIQKLFTESEDREKIGRYWTTFTIVRIMSYFLGAGLVAVLYPLSTVQNIVLAVSIFSIQFILVADLVFRSVSDAKGHTWQFSLTDFGSRIILVLALLCYDWLDLDFNSLSYFLIWTSISYTIAIVADSLWQKPHYHFGKFDFSLLRKYFRPMAYLGFSSLIWAIYYQSKKIFLKNYGFDEESLNGFGNAEKIFTLATIVPGLTMPMISSVVKKRMDLGQISKVGLWIQANFKLQKTSSIVGEWLVYAFVLSLSITIGLFLFGPLIIFLIDAENKYPVAYQILPILSVAMLPYSVILLVSHLIIFLSESKYEFLISVVLSIVGYLSLFYLTPYIGLNGTAWMTVAIFVLDLALKLFFLKITIRDRVYKLA